MIYQVESLNSAREFLKNTRETIILSNPPGSTRYYGMRVIDCIFNSLQQEFPDKINGVIINAFDDYAAFVTARKLGYNNIKYFNS